MPDGSDPSAVEQRLRGEVAACTRILVDENILDYSGHVSALLPGGETFLVQPVAKPRGDLEPDDLLVVDMNGRAVRGGRGGRPPAEVYIHSEIYRARPDVRAVLHCHPETAILFTLARGAGLVPVRNHAARWADGIPVHPDPGHIDTPALGRELAATLGGCFAALIRAHGAVLVAESVPALLADAVHFEENARAQLAAAQIGPVLPLSPEDVEAFLSRFDRGRHALKLWAYYLEKGRAAGVLPADWPIEEPAGAA